MTFAQFFHDAFHGAGRRDQAPYVYQCQLAGGGLGAGATPNGNFSHGTECKSQLINIPTGLGKTAGAVLAWYWNRVVQPDKTARDRWPRRLVYCLPMRTLVEQTENEVRKWLGDLLWDGNSETRKGKVGVHVLMGGEDAGEWDVYPEENAILIGTQDMLLSRALNRGYGMSRYRWPMHFGLLNNDALWVMDETQLMGVGVETSAQLDGFRQDGKMPTIGTCPTWWMSATLDAARLATVDHAQSLGTIALSDAERAGGRPNELITATKKLSQTALVLNSTTKSDYATHLATLIADRHQTGTLTLVVVNRVSRAREIFQALTTPRGRGRQASPHLYDTGKVGLIHSRFRPVDRERHSRLLFSESDRIIIATQAVEAGVDVSARLLITELAPWSSLVQRMGRCNRYANITDAEVLWVDVAPEDEQDDLALPYKMAELGKARTALASLTDASPQNLGGVIVAEEKIIRPVIRRRDLVDLFDTTPDICGQDLDVSRYIRDGEDSDVQFFWRDIAENKGPEEKESQPQRSELCRVSIGDAAKFLKNDKKARAWRWNSLERRWEIAKSPRPGGVYLIATDGGGYSDTFGWTGNTKDKPTPHPPTASDSEAHDSDPDSLFQKSQSISDHTTLVVAATDAL